MKHCCINCDHYIFDFGDIPDNLEEWCEKKNEEIPEGKSEEYCCDDYMPDSYTADCEREEAYRDSKSAKQRLMLKDLKEFLESYNAEDYEDNSPDVRAIYNVVRDMVWKCDPSRW